LKWYRIRIIRQHFELRGAYSLGKHLLVLHLFCAEVMGAIAVSSTFYRTYLGIIIYVLLLSSPSFDAGKSRSSHDLPHGIAHSNSIVDTFRDIGYSLKESSQTQSLSRMFEWAIFHNTDKRPLHSSPDIDQHDGIWAFSTAKIKWIAAAQLPPALHEYCWFAVWQFRCFKVQQYQNYVDFESQLFHQT
jgi:hypothetical protein